MLYERQETIYRQSENQINIEDDKSDLISFILGIFSFIVMYFISPIFSVVISGVGLFFGIKSKTTLNIVMHTLIIGVFVMAIVTIAGGL